MISMNRELLKRVLKARTIGYPLPPSLVKDIEAELAKPEPAIDNDLDWAIRYVIRDICEMSDRTSPDDMPDAMVVTPKELSEILRDHIGKLLADTKAETINNDSEPVLLVNVWRDGNLPCFNNEWLSFPATWENGSYKLYTNPPAQQKPLSDNEVRIIINSTFRTDTGWIEDFMVLVRSVEEHHGIK